MKDTIYIIQNILDHIKEHPGVSAIQIANIFGVSRVTIFRHLKILISLQKVRIQGQGKATRYFPHQSLYIVSNISGSKKWWNPKEVDILKEEVLFALNEIYGEGESIDYIDTIFEKYCMYIANDNTLLTGFYAFLGWCNDTKHNFSDGIVEKAIEYLEIIGSIEVRRKNHWFLDATELVRAHLNGLTDIAFDIFLFAMPSVLENGFGRTRKAIELYYGKLNSKYLLTHATESSIDSIREYSRNEWVDCIIFTPPTNNRTVQFRDILEMQLDLKLPKIIVEKVPPFGKILQPQKDIRVHKDRVHNAFLSLDVTIPNELNFYKHILILDDSFVTGSTQNAIALKLRNSGYLGKISVITICGSLNYGLVITEDEI